MALPKLYQRIVWHNDTNPALNEDNLNAMSKGLDDVDDRVIALGNDVFEVLPQIVHYLEQAEDLVEALENLSKNPPKIGPNGNWLVWDVETDQYIDSGIDASITVTIADITMLEPTATPYVTNTGTDTDPIFHLFIPRGTKGDTGTSITSIVKTGTSGLVDTYTITFSNSTTTTFAVTNGKTAYQSAVEGGYTGTEAEFEADLANFGDLAESAATSATTASAKASEAAASATTASTKADEAATSAATASSKADEAANSATSAASSASTATTKASEAATSASNAYNSELAADASATLAATEAGNAATSASDAANSEAAAAGSASTATTKAGEAADSATSAAGSASTATTKEAEASAAALNAEDSAEDSEAWAVGKRGGVDVPSTDPTYHNNAKYYSEQSGTHTFAGLQDVDINSSTLANGDVPVYNSTSSKWENKAAPIIKTATLSASYTTVTFTGLPTSGDHLIDFYTSTGINFTDINTATAGQVTLTFDAQSAAVTVYCEIKEV